MHWKLHCPIVLRTDSVNAMKSWFLDLMTKFVDDEYEVVHDSFTDRIKQSNKIVVLLFLSFDLFLWCLGRRSIENVLLKC